MIDRVKLLKQTQGTTYKFVAEYCNIDYAVFRNYLRGRRKLQPEQVEKLESFLKERGM